MSTQLQESAPAAQLEKKETPAALAERSLTLETWRVLQNVIWPGAAKETVLMAVDYCRARGLDPLKRPIHIVPVWDSKSKSMKDTIWPGISELRTTAFRTRQYAGRDATEFGPMITEKVGSAEMEYPEWASVTVYRMIDGQRVPFAGDRVYWRETYAQKRNDDPTPNSMWQRRPRGQLAKCAEAAAIRAAFPEEVGADYSADEMEGQRFLDQPSGPRGVQAESLDRAIMGEAAPNPDAEPQQNPPPPQTWPKRTMQGFVDSSGEIYNEDRHAAIPRGQSVPTVNSDGTFRRRRGSEQSTPKPTDPGISEAEQQAMAMIAAAVDAETCNEAEFEVSGQPPEVQARVHVAAEARRRELAAQ